MLPPDKLYNQDPIVLLSSVANIPSVLVFNNIQWSRSSSICYKYLIVPQGQSSLSLFLFVITFSFYSFQRQLCTERKLKDRFKGQTRELSFWFVSVPVSKHQCRCLSYLHDRYLSRYMLELWIKKEHVGAFPSMHAQITEARKSVRLKQTILVCYTVQFHNSLEFGFESLSLNAPQSPA